MFKKYTFLISFFLVAIVAVTIIFVRKRDAIPPLKLRNKYISASSEWVNTKAAIEGLQATLRKNPNDRKAKLNLAQAYIQEGRVTGDHAYYDGAALQLLNSLLSDEPQNFDALCCKATVYLSQHHFADALPIAEEARKVSDFNAFLHGIFTDAYVELGNYPKAIESAEKMISIRPDVRSYSRVSYLREIHGDYPGAIEAMDMAVKAGYPGLEQSAWARVGLGHLYEQTGDLKNAEMHYRLTLEQRPAYAYALAGLGRIEKTKGHYKPAIAYFEQASRLVKDYSFADEITDLYVLDNQPDKAEESAREVVEELSGDGHTGGDDDGNQIGHYADRELAYAYLKTKEYDLALKHAMIEYNRRPNNIDVNETLAWVHYKRGEFAQAEKYMQVAMRTHSQNPALLYRAGLIKVKNGDTTNGLALMKKSLEINPYLSRELTTEGKAYLASN